MGHLMRRNILTYKAPEGNEGYDLISIHPDARYKPKRRQLHQARVQVKSRYASDCNKGFPIKEKSLDAFDFLIVAFLNIGEFYRGKDGSTGARDPEYYTFTPEFIREHHDASSSWQKVILPRSEAALAPFKNETGFELVAKILGIPKPLKIRNP
jgi:hypothetical protein